jgi:hypothetical protein
MSGRTWRLSHINRKKDTYSTGVSRIFMLRKELYGVEKRVYNQTTSNKERVAYDFYFVGFIKYLFHWKYLWDYSFKINIRACG